MSSNEATVLKKSPDEIVERRILDNLKNKGLAGDDIIKKLSGKMSKGVLKAEDWQLIFEVALEKSSDQKEQGNED